MKEAGNVSYRVASVARLGMENASEVDLSSRDDATTPCEKRAFEGVIGRRLSEHDATLLQSRQRSTVAPPRV